MFIVEDDFIHANRLAMYLEELGYNLAGSATNVSEALNMITATSPDLILVDIHLNGERDGVQLVERLNEKNPTPVIFITSYKDKETIDRAKLTDPYAYIVKPYDKGTLQAAIELAVYKFSKKSDSTHTFTEWEEDRLVHDAMFVKSEGSLIKININDILYIEVRDKWCLLGVGDDIFEVRIPLQKLEERLPQSRFLRAHRSFIANKEAIGKIDLVENKVLIRQHVIPIGRSYREAFLNSLDILNS